MTDHGQLISRLTDQWISYLIIDSRWFKEHVFIIWIPPWQTPIRDFIQEVLNCVLGDAFPVLKQRKLLIQKNENHLRGEISCTWKNNRKHQGRDVLLNWVSSIRLKLAPQLLQQKFSPLPLFFLSLGWSTVSIWRSAHGTHRDGKPSEDFLFGGKCTGCQR